MSLVSSSAFQYSPALQWRLFITLGVLATANVDGDFFYQMFVTFGTALSRSSDSDTLTVVSMLRCFAKVVPALPQNSHYLPHLFWLAVSLLQSAYVPYYAEATDLLKVTMDTMVNQGVFDRSGVSATLLNERDQLEDITVQFDQILGLSFTSSFSFSLAAVIFKGMRHSGLKTSATGALRSLLRITSECKDDHEDTLKNPGRAIYYDALGYFLALLSVSTTAEDYRALLDDADADPFWFPESGSDDDVFVPRVHMQLLGIADATTALYATSFISAMLSTAQGDDAETEILCVILSDIADRYPDVIAMAYVSVHSSLSGMKLICGMRVGTKVFTKKSETCSPTRHVRKSSRRFPTCLALQCNRIPLVVY